MSESPQKTALITGGVGFAGSHLVERLLAEGWKVTVGPREANGIPAFLKSRAA